MYTKCLNRIVIIFQYETRTKIEESYRITQSIFLIASTKLAMSSIGLHRFGVTWMLLRLDHIDPTNIFLADLHEALVVVLIKVFCSKLQKSSHQIRQELSLRAQTCDRLISCCLWILSLIV